MNDYSTLDEFVPDSRVVAEYEALAAGDYAEGSRGRLLFVVSTTDLAQSHGDVYVALGLAKYLRRLGWGITLWPATRWADPTPEGFEAAIVMIESFVPGLVHPDTRLIAWVRNWTEHWAELPYLEIFDQIWCSSELAVPRLQEVYSGTVGVLKLGTDVELFTRASVERDRGVVTTANYWGTDRTLSPALELVAQEEPVTWFGRNMEYLDLPAGIDHSRRVDYFSLPLVYSTWRFVIDDAIPAAAEYGMQNSRLYDAIACGATVITNNALGLDSLGLQDVATYETPGDMVECLRSLRADPDAAAKTEALRSTVVGNHTYAHRAEEANRFLELPRRTTAERTALLGWSTKIREELRVTDNLSHELQTAAFISTNEIESLRTHHEALFVTSEELRAARDGLQAAYDELLATNEGLSATNHGLSASFDELRAAGDELRASNDALLATNEELRSALEDVTQQRDAALLNVNALEGANARRWSTRAAGRLRRIIPAGVRARLRRFRRSAPPNPQS